jgi:hypothetical protein
MRNVLIFCALFLFSFNVAPSKAGVEVSVGLNFNELDEYGEWVHVQGIGRVWRPDAESGWRPFMYGRWVYSNDGWLWDSDEPFGWIVCHYGNWYEDEEQGWVWVPGHEWSPARVEWYVTDNEIAWAPMFPPGHHHRFSRVQWSFCPAGFFNAGEVRSHVEFRLRPEPGSIHVKVYAGAPQVEFVQRMVHAPVVRVTSRRVPVANREHPLFKIEIGDHHHADVVVPVGRQYRREHDHGERHESVIVPSHGDERARVVVEPREEHERARVVVEPRREEHDHDARVIVQPRHEQERARVVVEPREEHERAHITVESRSDGQERKARVEVRSQGRDRDNDDNDNGDDNKKERKRVRVEVNGH